MKRTSAKPVAKELTARKVAKKKLRRGRDMISEGHAAFQRHAHSFKRKDVQRLLNGESCESLQLRGCDLSGKSLADRDLSNLDFGHADLSGADLQRCVLFKTNLSDANLGGANLTDATLSGAYLTRTNLSGANLTRAKLRHYTAGSKEFHDATLGSSLWGFGIGGIAAMALEQYFQERFTSTTFLVDADLSEADLTETDLTRANLTGAKLRRSNLTRTILERAILDDTDLTGAILNETNLRHAQLIKTVLNGATLRDCCVYGISTWDLELDRNTKQSGLVITDSTDSVITAPSLEIAQFIYLLLNNRNIRRVIDTITTKVVLILGSFQKKEKKVLDAIRKKLATRDYVPIMFDFDKPVSRDTMETVSALAHMSKFVIADLTSAKSVLLELKGIIPALPSVPIVLLLHDSVNEPGMADHLKNFRSVLPLVRYKSQDSLMRELDSHILVDAEQHQAALASREVK